MQIIASYLEPLTIPLLYLPVRMPLARGLQIVVPSPISEYTPPSLYSFCQHVTKCVRQMIEEFLITQLTSNRSRINMLYSGCSIAGGIRFSLIAIYNHSCLRSLYITDRTIVCYLISLSNLRCAPFTGSNRHASTDSALSTRH